MNIQEFYDLSVNTILHLLEENTIAYSLHENKTDYSLPHRTINECFITFSYSKKSKKVVFLVSTKSHKDLGIFEMPQLTQFIVKRYKSVKVQTYYATETLHDFQCSILLYGGK